MKRLTGPQKVAILLMSIGEDAAAEVIKELSEEEIHEVMGVMANYQEFTQADVDRVMNEFYARKDNAGAPAVAAPETKLAFLNKTLTKALGQERGAALLEKVMEVPKTGTAIEKLKWHSPRTIADVLGNEHPQVIAVVLACLDEPDLAGQVMAELPKALAEQVIERFAAIKGIQPEWLEEVEAFLAEKLGPKEEGQDADGKQAGAKRAAEILQAGGTEMKGRVLANMRQKDPRMATAVADKIVYFDHLIYLNNVAIQRVLEQADLEQVVLALSTADESLKAHILNNISIGAAHRIREELELLGPQRLGDIEAARNAITQIAIQLADDGVIQFVGL